MKEYQENYHYIQFDNLKRENEQLVKKLNEGGQLESVLDDNSTGDLKAEVTNLQDNLTLINEENKKMKAVVEKLEGENEQLIIELENLTREDQEPRQELDFEIKTEVDVEQQNWQLESEELQQQGHQLQDENSILLLKIEELEERIATKDSWFKRNLQKTNYTFKEESSIDHPKIKVATDKEQPTFLSLKKKDKEK